MNKVVIYVGGGNIQEVRAEKDIIVQVFDADNLQAKFTKEQIRMAWNSITKNTKQIKTIDAGIM